MATGTVTITEQTHKMVKKVTFDWTLVAGVASETTTNSYDGQVLRINAMACSCTGYALEVQDSDGVDLLGRQGATLTSGGTDFGTSTGNVEMPLSAVSSLITLDVSGTTGTTKNTGQTIVYIR